MEPYLAMDVIDFMILHVQRGGDKNSTLKLARELQGSALYLEMPRNFKVKFLNKYIDLEELPEQQPKTGGTAKPPKLPAIERTKENKDE